MRCLVPLLVCLLTPLLAQADADAKVNSLTEKESRDGWILLFDGQTTYGWDINGTAQVEDGVLILGGAGATKAFLTARFPAPFEFQVDLRGTGSNFWHVLGPQQPGSSGSVTGFGATWKTHRLRFRQQGNNFVQEQYDDKNGKWVLSTQNAATKLIRPALNRGYFHLGFTVGPQGHAEVRNFKLHLLGSQPLFNGKDLTGWKEFPGKKSKFTVTDEGWLNVKNGPGDLQTVGKFGDFVLQLECISNGEHLNSGIFFRCLPNLYQQGYEAQIRNQFTDEPKQKYTIEEYDPLTHQRIGKKTVQSTAVDYGTGAIYRRMPARREVAKDREWFTLTLVAHGNHFATWVNGIQVCDWTDNRPPNVNARQGQCLNAGPISIQGHDPSTNLSFRNFRIAEFPSTVQR